MPVSCARVFLPFSCHTFVLPFLSSCSLFHRVPFHSLTVCRENSHLLLCDFHKYLLNESSFSFLWKDPQCARWRLVFSLLLLLWFVVCVYVNVPKSAGAKRKIFASKRFHCNEAINFRHFPPETSPLWRYTRPTFRWSIWNIEKPDQLGNTCF